jgi:hypothetical protein
MTPDVSCLEFSTPVFLGCAPPTCAARLNVSIVVLPGCAITRGSPLGFSIACISGSSVCLSSPDFSIIVSVVFDGLFVSNEDRAGRNDGGLDNGVINGIGLEGSGPLELCPSLPASPIFILFRFVPEVAFV